MGEIDMTKLTDQIYAELLNAPAKTIFRLSRDDLIELMYHSDVKRNDGIFPIMAETIAQNRKLEVT
jgi:hypothetical protein